MKAKLTEARDILSRIMSHHPSWPVGLVRAHRLLEQVVNEWIEWEADDVVVLAPCIDDELVRELDEPFPAA
jgi:hypothetical protein